MTPSGSHAAGPPAAAWAAQGVDLEDPLQEVRPRLAPGGLGRRALVVRRSVRRDVRAGISNMSGFSHVVGTGKSRGELGKTVGVPTPWRKLSKRYRKILPSRKCNER
jgi:hypothetical protein